MRRVMVLVMTLFFFLGASQIYGAEKKSENKPVQKSLTPQEAKSPETSYHALIIGTTCISICPN